MKKISFYLNHCCYGRKVCRSMRRGAISIPQPASLVRSDVDNAEEWEQGTPSPPLHTIPPTPPPLPPDSLSIPASGSNPGWDCRHKRGINKSRSLSLWDCVAHFQVIWIGWGLFLFVFLIYGTIIQSKMKRFNLGGKKSSQHGDTDHDYRRWRVTGQGDRVTC